MLEASPLRHTRQFAIAIATTFALGGCLSDKSPDSTAGPSSGSNASVGAPAPVATPAPVPAPAPAGSPAPAGTPTPTGDVVKVGPTRALKTLGATAAVAKDTDVIEIDAGSYRGDETYFLQRRLTIRGVGGRAVFDGSGGACGQKAILVLHGEDMTLENLELSNCSVIDMNGAGIRHETGRLLVRNVVFRNNQEGILTGNNAGLGPTDARLSLEIYDSVFAGNGDGVGFAHNIYVGQIDAFRVEGSYFTVGKEGHLVKSRAAKNHILYNRITDETGRASYEVDLPNGGESYLIGNLIEQSAASPNFTIVSYGMEGLIWPKNELHMAHNTVVNHVPGSCTFVRTQSASTARLVNNLWVGGCGFAFGGTAEQIGSVTAAESEFANPAGFDYRLKPGSTLARTAASAGSVNGQSLVPAFEYRHTATRVGLTLPTQFNPGAFQ